MASGMVAALVKTQGAQRFSEQILTNSSGFAGIDGIFLETHENPAKAPSDGPNQIPHKGLPALLKSLLAIRRAVA